MQAVIGASTETVLQHPNGKIKRSWDKRGIVHPIR